MHAPKVLFTNNVISYDLGVYMLVATMSYDVEKYLNGIYSKKPAYRQTELKLKERWPLHIF